MRRGTVLRAEDSGTIWRLIYKQESDVIGVVVFDHRCFASFYEGATGSNFYRDYRFGDGRAYVAEQLRGLRVAIEGEPFNETVRVESDLEWNMK